MDNLDIILKKITDTLTQKLNSDVVTPIVTRVNDVLVKNIGSGEFIDNVVGKAIDASKKKLQNYIYIGGLMYALIIILLLFIIYLLYKKK
jgi:hypothetical protein